MLDEKQEERVATSEDWRILGIQADALLSKAQRKQFILKRIPRSTLMNYISTQLSKIEKQPSLPSVEPTIPTDDPELVAKVERIERKKPLLSESKRHGLPLPLDKPSAPKPAQEQPEPVSLPVETPLVRATPKVARKAPVQAKIGTISQVDIKSIAKAQDLDMIKAYYDMTTATEWSVSEMISARMRIAKGQADDSLRELYDRMRGQLKNLRANITHLPDLPEPHEQRKTTASNKELGELLARHEYKELDQPLLYPAKEEKTLTITKEMLRAPPHDMPEFLKRPILVPKFSSPFKPTDNFIEPAYRPKYELFPYDRVVLKVLLDAVNLTEALEMKNQYAELYRELVNVASETKFGGWGAEGQLIRLDKVREIHNWAKSLPSDFPTRLKKPDLLRSVKKYEIDEKEAYFKSLDIKLNAGKLKEDQVKTMRGSWASIWNGRALQIAISQAMPGYISEVGPVFPLAVVHCRGVNLTSIDLFKVDKQYSYSWNQNPKFYRDYATTHFNPTSMAGNFFGEQHKVVWESEMYMAGLILKDLSAKDFTLQEFLKKWGWLRICEMKPKTEPYDKMDVRNVMATQLAAFLPYMVLASFGFKAAPNFLHHDTSASLLQLNPFHGFLELLLNKLDSATMRKDSHPVILNFSDNCYVISSKYTIHKTAIEERKGAEVIVGESVEYTRGARTWASLDVSKMEASHRHEDFVKANLRLFHAFGGTMRQTESKSTMKPKESSLGPGWTRYLVNFSNVLLSESVLLWGKRQIPGMGLGSGAVGTGYYNHEKSATFIVECRRKERLPRILKDGFFAEDLKSVGTYGPLELHRPATGDGLSPIARDCATASTIKMKTEAVLRGKEDFFDAMRIPHAEPVPIDLLGYSCWPFKFGDLPVVRLPVLDRARLAKSILFRKSFTRMRARADDPDSKHDKQEEIKDFMRLVSFRALYLVGGWAYPAYAGLIRSVIKRDLLALGMPASPIPISDDSLNEIVGSILFGNEDGPTMQDKQVYKYLTAPTIPTIYEVLQLVAPQKGVRTPYGVVPFHFLRKHFVVYAPVYVAPTGSEDTEDEVVIAIDVLKDQKEPTDEQWILLARAWYETTKRVGSGMAVTTKLWRIEESYADQFKAVAGDTFSEQEFKKLVPTSAVELTLTPEESEMFDFDFSVDVPDSAPSVKIKEVKDTKKSSNFGEVNVVETKTTNLRENPFSSVGIARKKAAHKVATSEDANEAARFWARVLAERLTIPLPHLSSEEAKSVLAYDKRKLEAFMQAQVQPGLARLATKLGIKGLSAKAFEATLKGQDTHLKNLRALMQEPKEAYGGKVAELVKGVEEKQLAAMLAPAAPVGLEPERAVPLGPAPVSPPSLSDAETVELPPEAPANTTGDAASYGEGEGQSDQDSIGMLGSGNSKGDGPGTAPDALGWESDSHNSAFHKRDLGGVPVCRYLTREGFESDFNRNLMFVMKVNTPRLEDFTKADYPDEIAYEACAAACGTCFIPPDLEVFLHFTIYADFSGYFKGAGGVHYYDGPQGVHAHSPRFCGNIKDQSYMDALVSQTIMVNLPVLPGKMQGGNKHCILKQSHPWVLRMKLPPQQYCFRISIESNVNMFFIGMNKLCVSWEEVKEKEELWFKVTVPQALAFVATGRENVYPITTHQTFLDTYNTDPGDVYSVRNYGMMKTEGERDFSDSCRLTFMDYVPSGDSFFEYLQFGADQARALTKLLSTLPHFCNDVVRLISQYVHIMMFYDLTYDTKFGIGHLATPIPALGAKWLDLPNGAVKKALTCLNAEVRCWEHAYNVYALRPDDPEVDVDCSFYTMPRTGVPAAADNPMDTENDE
jgi:hypothetical protein